MILRRFGLVGLLLLGAVAAACPPPPTCPPRTQTEVQAAGNATLVAARMAAHECGDRVVFEFDPGSQVGYHLNYVSKPVIATSGEQVPVAGAATLSVTLFGQAHDDSGNSTYGGPRVLTSDTRNVREAVFVEDFEGYVWWVIGLDAERQFAVSTLADPPRLVIDFAP